MLEKYSSMAQVKYIYMYTTGMDITNEGNKSVLEFSIILEKG